MAIGLVVAAPVILTTFGFGKFGDALLQFGRWPALAVLLLIALALLYRFGQSRKSPKWKWVSIVAGIVQIARGLGVEVLAEGVENEEELTVLRAAGISLFQGYHFAKPGLMSLPDVPTLRMDLERIAV